MTLRVVSGSNTLRESLSRLIRKIVSEKEAVILTILSDSDGQTGLDIYKSAEGRISRGTIYGVLERLEDKGLITSEELPEGKKRYPQRRYFLSTSGHQTLERLKEKFLTEIVLNN